MKTLYVSDLDGTLLRRDVRISPYSCGVINSLIENGLMFSYATARSIYTAETAAQGLNVRLPVIINNGVSIIDPVTKKRYVTNCFSDDEAAEIYGILMSFGIFPSVDAIIDGNEKYLYDRNNINPKLAEFIASRKNDSRNTPLDDTSVILDGDVFYFTCIGEVEKLLSAYDVIKKMNDKYTSIFQYDIYSGEPWLEVMPLYATKANAVRQLKQMYNCDTVVVFGDGINDIPMFKSADRCYAVANAADELKALATDIIESNEDDGVARWLLENFNASAEI